MNEYRSTLINALRQASPQSFGNSGISFFGSPDRLGSSLSIKDNYGGANDPSVLEMVANTPYTVEYGNQVGVKTGSGGGANANAVQNALRQGSSSSFKNDNEPSAWDSMSSSEKAAWYRENPTMSKITQTLQDLWGMTSLGMLQNAMDPEGVYTQQAIARGFDPAEGWKATNDFGQSITSGGQAPAPAPEASNESSSNGWDSSGNNDSSWGPYSGGGDYSGYTTGSSDDSGSSDSYSYSDSGSSDSYSYSSGWSKGGKVTKDRLTGPDPKGPDDGFGALDAGEFVITKDAAKKLGPEVIELLQRLNANDKKGMRR